MKATTKATMMSFDIPDDPEQLQAWGVVMLRHSQLDYSLRMTIKTLSGVEIAEALDATQFTSTGELHRRINRLARKALGEGPALIRLQAILTRCKRATKKRNDLVHNIVGRELDGEVMMRTEDHSWRHLPTLNELEELNLELIRLAAQINVARINGFVREALDAKAGTEKQPF